MDYRKINKNKIQAVDMKFFLSGEGKKRRGGIRNVLDKKLEFKILQVEKTCGMTQNKMDHPVTRRH
jgi:hypothetical protein